MKNHEDMAQLMGIIEHGVLLQLPSNRMVKYNLDPIECARLASDVQLITEHYNSKRRRYDEDPDGNYEPTPILPYGYVDFTETADGAVTIYLECAHETCPFRWCRFNEKYSSSEEHTGIECTC